MIETLIGFLRYSVNDLFFCDYLSLDGLGKQYTVDSRYLDFGYLE